MKEALKLALEALELNNKEWKSLADSGDAGYWKAEDQDHYKQTEEAITAIKEELAETQYWNEKYKLIVQEVQEHPPQRTWVGLTDEEIQVVAKQARSKDHAVTLTNKLLREKNV